MKRAIFYNLRAKRNPFINSIVGINEIIFINAGKKKDFNWRITKDNKGFFIDCIQKYETIEFQNSILSNLFEKSNSTI